MYLEHFGLTEPPFKITPVTEFFFAGANRGEILDALIYAITDGEGIVKISGEVGSGKTMLCRMLLDRLPLNIKAIHLANPSMSRDELLYAIADRLGLNLEGQRVNVILQTLQNQLEEMYGRGERCVVLVDEAHAMPLDTLEELRLLYNLQVGKHKLIQIVLFGQPELDKKLEQSNMRQLKDRIVHHFSIQPLSRKIINDYLMFRMRAAGYKGPDIFSPAAVLLIGKASQGLMRRVNILADKALLAAFVQNTHRIEVRQVQAAIRDSEMVRLRHWLTPRNIPLAGGAILLTVMLAGAGWLMGENNERLPGATAQHSAATTSADTANVTSPSPGKMPAFPEAAIAEQPLPLRASREIAVAKPTAFASNTSLLQQRLDATRAALSAPGRGGVSIQLFYTDDNRPERMERFLERARRLERLAEIYIVPIKLNGKDGYRILHGLYASNDAARAGMDGLPRQYKNAFAPTLYLLDGSYNSP